VDLLAPARGYVDIVELWDDMAGQAGMLVDPAWWRRVIRPYLAREVELIHEHGMRVLFHSCGAVRPVLPDLVEIGLDALNAQIFCMDIEAIGRSFAGKLTFWGEVDRQHLLPYGTPAEVAAAVRTARRALWRGGGAIAQCEFGIGARPENVAAVFEAWNTIA